MIVGAHRNNIGSLPAGSAYIYDLSSITPNVPVTTLNNPTPAAGDSFGGSVAISGTRVVVGAHMDDTGATDSGSAYVYDLTRGIPSIPIATLNNPGPAVGDRFGGSVAIFGRRVVVGAHQDDTGGTDAGAAYVYDLGSATPAAPVITLNNPGPAASDQFGISVGIFETRVDVGAHRDDTNAQDSGSVYVYNLDSAIPTTPALTLNNPEPEAGDGFGYSVAIAGSKIVGGANLDDAAPIQGAGSAYMYDVSSETPMVPLVTLRNPSPAPNDNFGSSVAFDGGMVAVGAPLDNSPQADKGSVYVFGPASPFGGTMKLTPASPVNSNAMLTVTFAGWMDPNGPLSYSVLIQDVIVSPAGATASRNFTGPSLAGAYTLKGRITDALGNMTEVTQLFAVNTPHESWRFTYFGTTENTGNAHDFADPDEDGQNNNFEFTAGLIPTDPLSRFWFHVESVAEDPQKKALIFSPIVTGRTYELRYKSSLTEPAWTPLIDFTASDNGDERTVIDLDASAAARFYEVEITRP